MITVNVWDGHASFVIGAGPDGPETTVSWWPRDGGFDLITGDEPYIMPYETELLVEAGVALKRYRIFTLSDAAAGVPGAREHIGLDAGDVRDWWAAWQINGFYRLRDRNCCHTVVAGLLAGGALEYTERAGHHHLDPAEHFMTPGYVHRMCRAIIHGMGRSRF